MTIKDTGVIILAGGESERIGFPKPFLMLGGKTFLETIIQHYNDVGIAEVIVVLNKKLNEVPWRKYLDPIGKICKMVVNKNPEAGRRHSLKLGLDNLGDLEYCFVHNVDSPDVGSDLLRKIYEARNPEAYVQPVYKNQKGHPILLPKYIFKKIAKEKEDQPLNIELKKFASVDVPVNTNAVLMNINTTEEYFKYLQSRI